MSIQVFPVEEQLGLADAVRSNTCLAYASKLVQADQFAVPSALMATLQKSSASSLAKHNELCLHYLKTILVTTGWNKNDDFFERLETWAARHTPEDTPLNYEHQCDQIMGHIVGNEVIDDEGKIIADESKTDDLPAKFHILTPSVLYKLWDKAELQERMDNVIKEIAEGKWFVSMECYFRGFDYALLDSKGNCRIIARNEATAFLTKHLRSYGGTGKYGEDRIARVLRSISFSGKGLVKNPANPESVILATASENISHISYDLNPLVFSEPTAKVQTEISKTMAVEITEVQKQLDKALAENETLKLKIAEHDGKAFQAKLDSALAEVAEAKKNLEDVTAKLAASDKVAADVKAEAEAAKLALAAKTEEANKSADALAKATEQLNAIETEKRVATRVLAIKTAFGVDDETAGKMNTTLAALNDEAFQEYLKTMATVKSTPAPLPPKSTPASLPPKSTNHPSPQPSKGAEKSLDNPEGAAGTGLSTETESPANTIAKSIASLFGKGDDNQDNTK